MSEPSALPSFKALFGRLSAVGIEAHGRVNLIGEHTDYNGGFVLPAPIPQRTRVELAPRPDALVRVASTSIGGTDAVRQYALGGETRGQGWVDYVQGVTVVLRGEGSHHTGFDARIDSNIPLGSGVSSSAALEVALLRALRQVFDLDLDDVTLALAGQRAEIEFVGARVGVMDQMAAALSEPGSALFIDTRSLGYEHVPLPAEAELVVISSGVSHSNASGDYNTRRAECERACAALGVGQLRELGASDLPRLAALPESLGRRARHVVTENERVLAAVAALRAGDLNRLGRLFAESHASMRDDYAVSVPEIDLLVELAGAQDGVFGARLTGGGFGGSIVALVRSGDGARVARNVTREYARRTGRSPSVLVPARRT